MARCPATDCGKKWRSSARVQASGRLLVSVLALHAAIPCLLSDEHFGELMVALGTWAIVTCRHVGLCREIPDYVRVTSGRAWLDGGRANERVAWAEWLALLANRALEEGTRCIDHGG